MSKLIWDEEGKKFFHTGVHQTALFVFDPDPAVMAYMEGVAWSGITNITEKSSGGDETKLWADNIQYGSMRSAEEYGLTIEGYTYPDEFAQCDGSLKYAPGVFVGQQTRRKFGLAWMTNIGSDTIDPNDIEAPFEVHIAWGLSAAPSEKASNTINDNPDADTMSWDTSSVPVAIGEIDGKKYKPCSCITLDSRTADSAKLQTVMDTLFGSDAANAKLPSPAEIMQAMK